jgi:ribonuclease D
LPRNIRGARLQALEEAIARAAGMEPAQWPERRILERGDRLPANCREQFDALRSECARIAADLGIAVSTLAPRAALEAVARSRPQRLDEIMKGAGLLHWQAELVAGALQEIQVKKKN